MEINTIHLIIVLLTALTAYSIKGITGFGLSLIMVPILSLFLDFRIVVMVVTFADILSSGVIYLQQRKKIKLKKVFTIISGLFFGTFLGVTLFSNLPVESLKKIFGVLLIILTIKNLLKRSKSAKWKYRRPFAFVSGLLGGICGGMFNVNGPPIVMYLKRTLKDKQNLRSNLSAIFFFDAIWRGVLLVNKGYLTSQVITIFTFTIIPGMAFGFMLTNIILKKIDNKHISAIIEFLLLFLGGGLVFN